MVRSRYKNYLCNTLIEGKTHNKLQLIQKMNDKIQHPFMKTNKKILNNPEAGGMSST
jgi:hypothetical protein